MAEQFRDWITNKLNQKFIIEFHKRTSPSSKPMKSLRRAESLRKNGNIIYPTCNSDEDFHKAFACYAKSIAHAPAGSREMALAYSNLSAVLLRLGKHSECLEAIDCCLNSDYPEESKFKLYLRRIECLKVVDEPVKARETFDQTLSWIQTKVKKNDMKKQLEDCFTKQIKIQLPFTNEEIDKVWNRFSIKSFNKEIPGASDAISLKYSESQGRHFVAERDIRPGEILLENKPYSIICAGESRYNCCWECCKSMTNCIQCDHCEQVIFCSEKCKQQAWNDYHYVECKLVHYFLTQPYADGDECVDVLIAAFRFLPIAIKEYGSVQKMREAVNEMEQTATVTDPRTKGFINGQLLVDKYVGFINLKSHYRHSEETIIAFVTSVMYQLAITTTLLGKQHDSDFENLAKNEDFVFATCAYLKHMDIVTTNRSNMEKCFTWTGHTKITCLSIPASFFNHSCVPNVFTFHTKEYTKIICNRPIKKGEQVFLDYMGISTFPEEKNQGRFSLKHEFIQINYNFDCNCAACTNNWPIQIKYPNRFDETGKYSKALSSLYQKTQTEYVVLYDIDLKHGQNLRRNYRSLMDTVKKISFSIEKLHANVPIPCIEIFNLQMCLLEFCMKLHSAFT